MTTVVLERIADILIIAVLLRALMFFVPDDRPDIGKIRWAANGMFALSFGGFGFLLFARARHDFVVSAIRKVFGFAGPARAEKVVGIVDGFVGALKQLPDGKNLALFLLWTGIYWAINGAGMMVFANGFDCSGATQAGCHPLHVDLFQSFFLLCVIIIGMLIPAGPAGAGTTQAALIIGLGVFFEPELVNSSGVAFSIALWVVQVLQQVLLGLFYLVRSHASFSAIAGKLNAEQRDGSAS
jgi:hypothetical protein